MLNWLLPRRQAILYLAHDLDGNAADFSAKEISLLRNVAVEEGNQSCKFWAVANLCFQLASWGAGVSAFFHSCPLSNHPQKPDKPSCQDCVWKGRMAVKLAQGTWLQSFSQDLLNLTIGRAHQLLGRLPESTRNALVEEFSQCKTAMTQRFLQVFNYWRELPWRICAVASNLFYVSDDPAVEDSYIQVSKTFAGEILEMWRHKDSGARVVVDGAEEGDHGGHCHFQMARLFLDPSFPGNLSAYMVYWSSTTDKVMPTPLSKELMKYTSSLTCMQSLEAQHHFVNQRISFGRASLPASTCAFLRRRTNDDISNPFFKDNLSRYIENLSSLIASPWNNRSVPCCFEP